MPRPPHLLINPIRLIDLLLDQKWHKDSEIIPNHLPPHAIPGTKPAVIVKHDNGTDHPSFLRHSTGPKQGFYWDVVGDDMQQPELAILALSKAPYPHKIRTHTPPPPPLPPITQHVETEKEKNDAPYPIEDCLPIVPGRINVLAAHLGRELSAEEVVMILASDVYAHKNWHSLGYSETALVDMLERAGYITKTSNGFTGRLSLPGISSLKTEH